MSKVLFALTFFSLLFAAPVFAHPGNTDSYGCHTCRTNCPKWGLTTGEYHCHNKKTLPQAKQPTKNNSAIIKKPTTPKPIKVVYKLTEEDKYYNRLNSDLSKHCKSNLVHDTQSRWTENDKVAVYVILENCTKTKEIATFSEKEEKGIFAG